MQQLFIAYIHANRNTYGKFTKEFFQHLSQSQLPCCWWPKELIDKMDDSDLKTHIIDSNAAFDDLWSQLNEHVPDEIKQMKINKENFRMGYSLFMSRCLGENSPIHTIPTLPMHDRLKQNTREFYDEKGYNLDR
eukprot:UN28885